MSPIEPRPGLWTVADIGGTHARLAPWSAATGLGEAVRLRNDDYAGPIELLQHWFGDKGHGARQVLLALAMPVGADATTLTNRAWQFEPDALRRALQLTRIAIVNDFAAAAAGIDTVPVSERISLDAARRMLPTATQLVVGPGTGLGAAAVLDDVPPRALASEAGHMSFGSADRLAERLLADGRKRWGRVSWERVLCGEGLAWIESHVAARAAAESPAEVARRASADDPNALAAVRTFSRLLGEFAGDVCLAFQAGAVYLTGGVLHGIASTFDAPAFLAAFADKGRYATMLNRVPCFLIAGHELGLAGAARFLAGQCRIPVSEWSE